MPHTRDNFSRPTITLLAKSVGYHCSNPACRRSTVAARAAQDGVITIGVAAHIRAASPGGPRYDHNQSSQQRSAAENGIWLCQNCARLIDADAQKFTVDVLTTWKRDAQARAFRALVGTEKTPVLGQSSSQDEADETLFLRLLPAMSADLATYRRAASSGGDQIELTLRIDGDNATPPFSIGRLPAALDAIPEIIIVAPPGTGKTTTLLQLASRMLAARAVGPVYVPLGDWAAKDLGVFEAIAQRQSFATVQVDELRTLARSGGLALLLDGWNELDPGARLRLRHELDELRREYPAMRLVASTRRQAMDIPLYGEKLLIDPLSEDQQLAIASALAGDEGARVVDDAWRNPDLRSLITIPLYLSSLLASGTAGAIPTTKDGVLELFVRRHENTRPHEEALWAVLRHCHRSVLAALAMKLTGTGRTSMKEAEARQEVDAALAALREAGQLRTSLEPADVLELLTGHHLLTQTGQAHEHTIGFQHQQFQEWFASFELAELIHKSAQGDVAAGERLRLAALDRVDFEEAALFAVERIAREPDGAAVAAHAVKLALFIDPMLAAEMIYRGTSEVWAIVEADIVAFATRWHKAGTVDRAVRFMVITGRPEFASVVWPLATSTDSQIQIPTLRSAPRFRPSVLGDIRAKVAALSDDVRQNLLTLMASESGVDGMDLAVALAAADPSPSIQGETVSCLLFRRAERHAASLLDTSHAETWRYLAAHGLFFSTGHTRHVERLAEARDQLMIEAANNPLSRLALVNDMPDEARDRVIIEAVADPALPVKEQHTDTAIHLAHERARAAVAQGLLKRVAAGLPLPFRSADYLKSLPVVDDGPVAARILDVSCSDRAANGAAVLAGPKTAMALLEQYRVLEAASQGQVRDPAKQVQIDALHARLSAARPAPFLAAIVSQSATDTPDAIGRLCDLINAYREFDSRTPSIPMEAACRAALIDMLHRWADVLLAAPSHARMPMSALAVAIGRLGLHELAPDIARLLEEDLRQLRKTRKDIIDSRAAGGLSPPMAVVLYAVQYQSALTQLGGDKAADIATRYLEDMDFGFFAAQVLKALSEPERGASDPRPFKQWPQFDHVAEARGLRLGGLPPAPRNAHGAAILAAIDRLAKAENSAEQQKLALALMPIALSLPHANVDALTDRVLALPLSLMRKNQLLAAMVPDGRILSADMLVNAIDAWLDDAQKNAWATRQHTREIESWLELLPFSDRPETVLVELSKVKAFYQKGWRQRLERVLASVALLPGTDGEALLIRLAQDHGDIADIYTWSKAFFGRETASSWLAYVDLGLSGAFGDAWSRELWNSGRQIAAAARKFPQIRAWMKTRAETAGGDARTLYEAILAETCSDDELIALVTSYGATGRPYDGSLSRAVHAATIDQSTDKGSGWITIEPRSVGALRLRLLTMAAGISHEAAIATACLTAVDALHDEYGVASGDPRHPNLSSGLIWPVELRSANAA